METQFCNQRTFCQHRVSSSWCAWTVCNFHWDTLLSRDQDLEWPCRRSWVSAQGSVSESDRLLAVWRKTHQSHPGTCRNLSSMKPSEGNFVGDFYRDPWNPWNSISWPFWARFTWPPRGSHQCAPTQTLNDIPVFPLNKNLANCYVYMVCVQGVSKQSEYILDLPLTNYDAK